jgi:L-ribulose-5-phosphate 3-epimerase UlaE
MNRKTTEFDCAQLLQMLKETPDAGAVIIDMISELGEVDASCLRKVRDLQAAGTGFDCASILQMLKETPDAGAVIVDMISELGEADEDCLRKVKDLQAARTIAA